MTAGARRERAARHPRDATRRLAEYALQRNDNNKSEYAFQTSHIASETSNNVSNTLLMCNKLTATSIAEKSSGDIT